MATVKKKKTKVKKAIEKKSVSLSDSKSQTLMDKQDIILSNLQSKVSKEIYVKIIDALDIERELTIREC